MDKNKIARINELARKAKAGPPTPQEQAERQRCARNTWRRCAKTSARRWTGW